MVEASECGKHSATRQPRNELLRDHSVGADTAGSDFAVVVAVAEYADVVALIVSSAASAVRQRSS